MDHESPASKRPTSAILLSVCLFVLTPLLFSPARIAIGNYLEFAYPFHESMPVFLAASLLLILVLFLAVLLTAGVYLLLQLFGKTDRFLQTATAVLGTQRLKRGRVLAVVVPIEVDGVLDIRDVGRIDFRIDDEGKLHFIEVDALPSLEEGASIYASASRAGLTTMEAVLGAIVESAAERFHLSPRSPRISRRSNAHLRVGLTFNLRRTEKLTQGNDFDAEYDSPKTIAAIREAIESYGHNVVELEATPELPSLLPSADVDLVFNIAEGFRGRHRESQIPALLELMGIPYTGSDPTALSLALDKGLAKRVVRQAGLLTPPFVLLTTGRERLPRDFSFPAIVKPVAEGSSKGILATSVVESEAALRELAAETLQDRLRTDKASQIVLPANAKQTVTYTRADAESFLEKARLIYQELLKDSPPRVQAEARLRQSGWRTSGRSASRPRLASSPVPCTLRKSAE